MLPFGYSNCIIAEIYSQALPYPTAIRKAGFLPIPFSSSNRHKWECLSLSTCGICTRVIILGCIIAAYNELTHEKEPLCLCSLLSTNGEKKIGLALFHLDFFLSALSFFFPFGTALFLSVV